MSNWKRTCEELPKDNENVIFRTTKGYCYYGWYDAMDELWVEDGDFNTTSFSPKKVTSWCPIPEYDLEDE